MVHPRPDSPLNLLRFPRPQRRAPTRNAKMEVPWAHVRAVVVWSNWARGESKVLPGEAMGMLEAARTARRLRDPGWRGEEGQGKWQTKKLLEC